MNRSPDVVKRTTVHYGESEGAVVVCRGGYISLESEGTVTRVSSKECRKAREPDESKMKAFVERRCEVTATGESEANPIDLPPLSARKKPSQKHTLDPISQTLLPPRNISIRTSSVTIAWSISHKHSIRECYEQEANTLIHLQVFTDIFHSHHHTSGLPAVP
jgi:hypothetical protein